MSRALVLLLLSAAALADGDCKGQSCNDGGDVTVGGDTINVGGDTITGGDVSVGVQGASQMVGGSTYKSKAFGVSNAFGDVAIVGCVISEQTNIAIVGWQRYDYDYWCIAERLDLYGKHADAAMLRCEIRELRKAFGDRCEAALTFAGPVPGATVAIEDEPEDADEEHEQMLVEYRALAERVEDLQQQVRRGGVDPALVQRIQRIESAKARTRAILEEAKQ